MSSLILLTAGLVAGLAAGLAGSGSLLLAPALVLVLPRWPMPVGGVLLGLLLGSVGPDARAPRSVADLHLPARYLVEAQVRTASPPTATGQTALLAVATIDGRECRGVGIRLHLPTPELLPGDRIEGTLRLSRPPAPRNPGEVDRRARALRAGIHLRAWADAPGQVRVLARSRSMSGLVARLRHAAARRLDRQLPPRDAGLARALVLGDRSAITGADRRLFARTGQGHLIAVSGLHVGLVLAASLFLLGRLGVPLSGRWLCGLLLVAFYVPFAGAAPSTVRAGAGAALYFGGSPSGTARGTAQRCSPPWSSRCSSSRRRDSGSPRSRSPSAPSSASCSASSASRGC